ncbi:MAG: beta-ketoacyl synthase chain length factor [Burkholderiales bacterium]|nr:beta-ketoacyl synthase chain length factor [Burkholderiales bacterium]
MITVGIAGIGLLGPGLADWATGRAALLAPASRPRTPSVVPAPQRLPATERRRAGALVRASIAAADQALDDADAQADAAAIATVFTSSTGDPLNCHLLCEALAAPERIVSPTRFTNSVHNAAAGYWHIAVASRRPSTSLAVHDASFGVGLLEAAVQCAAAQAPVLLVACDLPYPEPLHALRPVIDVFATALLLVPAGGRRLRLQVGADGDSTRCADAALEALRLGMPAARALPLLQALAAGAAATVRIEGQPGWALDVELESAATTP